MKFIETRGNDGIKPKEVEFSYALLNPIASFGGLFVPKFLPKLEADFFQKAKNKSYKEITKEILQKFKIDIDEKTIDEAISLYDKFDDGKNPVPLRKIEEDLYINELYHGPTRAFKDMALQPFGHILSDLAKKQKQNYLILAATSGDTGPAVLDTFSNKDNIKVACMYPDGGTSDVQRLQMVTQSGKNLQVLGIVGNFDDAQNTLKSLLASPTFKEELQKQNTKVSAANSVNFGRIIFQIIYHIYGYISLSKEQKTDEFYEIIPSGNFGNALGAYYAKKMGLPIKKILIASNINNILTDFINSGVYDLRGRVLLKTTSPAMDILISSNVERVLFDKFGASRCKELIENLKQNKFYKLSKDELEKLREDFDAVYCDDDFAKKTIKKYANRGYTMDPHTATTLSAYESLKKEKLPCVACSTAEWTKFAPTMLNAIKNDNVSYSDEEALSEFSKTLNLHIPKNISELFDKKVLHEKIVNKKDIEEEILTFIRG
ncbi:MAG: threonine synthase [Epsilonproteobacteria bacterium]|nr:threonine synthase [Campylobacterota bacterium]